MGRKFFGTDGIRGRVGEHPLTADFVLRLGWAAGRVLAAAGGSTVLIGKDTRISGYMFESALEAGFSAAGVNIRLLGPLPTPGIAYLTQALGAQAGVVISASHNPYHDNGIKFFSAAGRKLADDIELAIEEEISRPFVTVDSAQLGNARRVIDAVERYAAFCLASAPDLRLDGLHVVLDCANGAAYQVAPQVFNALGAKLDVIGNTPDGLNINSSCGSTYIGHLRAEVLARGADLGIALDGDADRVLMVDHKGEIVDGDELLFIIAMARKTAGELRGPVVGTLMTNFGLEKAFAERDIAFHRAKVGDRYVLAMLDEQGGILGGESSGHILCLDKTSTGDGTIAALQVLQAVQAAGSTLHELKQGFRKFPQELVNVKVRERPSLETSSIVQAVKTAEERLGNRGRVLLRPSGTEPLIRVMVEGEDAALVHELAESLAAAVAQAAK